MAAARAAAGPQRLLARCSSWRRLTTAVLSLDATVVLLTPVVFATAARLGVRARPHVYACAHLSNTASLLLPVSNLTNLLAFAASGLSFTRFAALMALPWLVAIGAEYLVFRRFFATDLAPPPSRRADERPEPVPVFALVVVACTLAGFVLTSAVGRQPGLGRRGRRAVLAGRALARRRRPPAAWCAPPTRPSSSSCWRSAVVVRAVVDNGLGRRVAARAAAAARRCSALLGVAALAAVAGERDQQPARRAGPAAAGGAGRRRAACWPCWSG